MKHSNSMTPLSASVLVFRLVTFHPSSPKSYHNLGKEAIKISAISYEVGKVQTRAYRNFFSAALAQFLKNRVAFPAS